MPSYWIEQSGLGGSAEGLLYPLCGVLGGVAYRHPLMGVYLATGSRKVVSEARVNLQLLDWGSEVLDRVA